MRTDARTRAPPYDAAMADQDSAFLWETEALRASSGQIKASGADDGWLTLREAEEETGIPIATLRKWARREAVPSYLDDTPVGQLRMVSRQGVRRRAAKLGRTIKDPPPAPPAPPRMATPEPELRARSAPTKPEQTQSAPPGTMLVPIDAWDKMLMQLGNLHQAGQELAEARERAAKAETEVKFLKERFTELRTGPEAPVAQPESTRVDPSLDEEVPETVSEIVAEPEIVQETPEETHEPLNLPNYSLAVVRHLYATWRNRPRR